jgi:predicted CXXCH cytochrome family protein
MRLFACRVSDVLAFDILSGVFKAMLLAMVFCNSGFADAGPNETPNDSLHDPLRNKGECGICHLCAFHSGEAHSALWDSLTETDEFSCFTKRAGQDIPLAISQLCLSCHDDVIAPVPPTSESWFARPPLRGVPASELLRKDEIEHHPYQLEYPSPGNPDFLLLGENPACPLPLFSLPCCGNAGGSMECSTCHDLHFPAAAPNLRVSIKQHELCRCCHRAIPEMSGHVYLPMQKEKRVIESGDCRSCHVR